MKILNKIQNKLQVGWWVIKTFKNWPLWFKYRFNLIDKSKERIFCFRNGLKFLASNKEIFAFTDIFKNRIYNKNFIFSDNSTIIDIGANIGAFSILAATSAKRVKVYAYEPVPDVFLRFIKNIKLNNLTNSIKPFNLGVGGENREEEIFVNLNQTTSSSIYQRFSTEDEKVIKIKIITLGDIFEENHIESCDFLKIDAEGTEYEILFNTPEKYFHRIKNIALEFHHGAGEIKKFLEKKGFSVTTARDLGLDSNILYAWKI